MRGVPRVAIATHHAAFPASAFCKVQLILRSCGSGGGGGAEAECAELRSDSGVAERNAARSSAWQVLHLNLTFSRLSVFKNRKVYIPLYA